LGLVTVPQKKTAAVCVTSEKKKEEKVGSKGGMGPRAGPRTDGEKIPSAETIMCKKIEMLARARGEKKEGRPLLDVSR